MDAASRFAGVFASSVRHSAYAGLVPEDAIVQGAVTFPDGHRRMVCTVDIGQLRVYRVRLWRCFEKFVTNGRDYIDCPLAAIPRPMA